MKNILFSIFILYTGSSYAQRAPTDIELKSEYCIAVLQESLKGQKELSGKIPESNYSKQLLQKTEQNLNRLRSYLLPRVEEIKLEGLILASERARRDRENYSSCSPQCKDLDTMGKCLEACSKRIGDPLTRLRSCHDINFLPF